jgi:hypothetical protein
MARITVSKYLMRSVHFAFYTAEVLPSPRLLWTKNVITCKTPCAFNLDILSQPFLFLAKQKGKTYVKTTSVRTAIIPSSCNLTTVTKLYVVSSRNLVVLYKKKLSNKRDFRENRSCDSRTLLRGVNVFLPALLTCLGRFEKFHVEAKQLMRVKLFFS